MQLIEFEGDLYPEFQSLENASQFSIPFAKHFVKVLDTILVFAKRNGNFLK